MNSKKLFVALAMPMLFAACSQEELATVDNVKTDLSNRKVVENVGLNLDGVNSRLSVVEGGVYAGQWDANDGVGACIIDIPTYTTNYPTAAQIAANGIQYYYTVQDYVSSNYKYSKGEDGAWTTQALMVEGNYMFYAPHSESFLTRKPIVASFPAKQSIDPAAEIRNSSIQDFYQSGAPVVVGYEFLSAANQDAVISPKLYNIYAYPKFTLKNSYKDEDGVAQDLTISKIVIKQNSGAFTTQAYIDNEKIKNMLMEQTGGSSWTKRRIETAVTSEILGTSVKTANEIVVDFGDGLEVATGEKEEFFIVLPAEDYRSTAGNQLTVEIYTTDDMKFANAFTMKSFVLNPGNAYPAEEYNTKSQTLKESKGKLATIDMKGSLIDLNAKNTGIKNNEELINYITNVAKRFDDIREVSNKFVANNTFDAEEFAAELGNNAKYYYQYDPQLYFTLDDDAEIVINDELIEVLIDQLGDHSINSTQEEPKLTFLAKSLKDGKIKLGNLTKYNKFTIDYSGKVGDAQQFENEEDEETYTWYPYAQNQTPSLIFEVEGNVTLTGNLEFTRINVNSGATLTLDEDLNAPNLLVLNNGGTVNYEGAVVASILNDNDDDNEITGTLNMNASSTGIFVYNHGYMYVKGGNVNTIVTVAGMVRNYADAVIDNEGILANVENNGTINVNAANAQVTATVVGGPAPEGTIVNNSLGKVSVNGTQTQDVVLNLTAIPSEETPILAKHGINHVIFTCNNLTIDSDAWDIINGASLNKVEFNVTNLVTPDGIDASSATFVFNKTAQWGGSETADETPVVTVNKVQVKSGKKVSVNYLQVNAEVSGNLVEGNNGGIN